MNASKNILITGVATGIGYGAARELISRGYTIFGSVRKAADAEKLKTEFGEKFIPVIFDVTDQAAVLKAAEEVKHRLNGEGLGGLINNSGISVSGPLQYLPIDELRKNFEVNVFGLVQVTQAFLPLLGAQPFHPSAPGRILNISSVAGKMAPPYMSPYVGTKHAVEGISHSMRRELMQFGIDVIIIGPGAVQTPIWDKGSLDKYKDTPYIASLAKFFTKFITEGKKGMPLDVFSNRLADIFETPKPKTRYAIVQRSFFNWTLPRLLPDRTVDNFFKKLM
jgi:NAD(P)-dependent dehydrogenase (short-subunit alcohol dehydrogenase family)